MLTALLAGLVLCLAGMASASVPNPRFERVSIEQGLSQESVMTILQDRQGFMWFGTQAGLNRYDGYQMTVYRNELQDPGSLPDSYINATFEDAEGRLWFGTKGGLARLDAATGKFVRYVLDDAVPAPASKHIVSAIVGDRHGILWLGTNAGLKRFDPASGSSITIPYRGAQAQAGLISALAFDEQGVLWVGSAQGVARLLPGASTLEALSATGTDPRRARVLALSMGPRGTLWVGTEGGLEAWQISAGQLQRRFIGSAEGGGEGRVLSLYHDAGGTLWVGTELDGLKWRDPSSGRFVSYLGRPLDTHGLSDNEVTAVLIDRTGTLWVGSRFGGLSRADLASGGFSHFSYRPAQGYRLGYEKARALVARADGKMWLSSAGGGLILLDPASGRTEQRRYQSGRADTIPNDVVHSLSLADGKLWVGSAGALAWSAADGGPFQPVALPGLGAAMVQKVVQTRDGRVWVATRAGLFLLDATLRVEQVWRHDPRRPDGIGDDTVYSMVEDGAGMLWFATENGLDRFDRERGVFTHFRHDPHDPGSLRHNRIYHLNLSARGQLWIGTAGGLHRLDADASGKPRFRYFALTDGPDALPIGAVLEDGNGRIWASTTKGIARLDPVSGNYKHYTSKDGLLDGSYFVGAGTRTPDGQLHFGGVKGISSFRPDEIRDNPYPPLVRITDFLVSNKPYALPAPIGRTAAITLSHHDAVFSIEFAALHFAAPQSNRYAYRLEGFDEGWIETDARKRFATYTNLDPGRYLFRVRASNKDGIWSEAPAALTITITPPWWKSWWFRLLAAALLLALAVAAYRLRVHALFQQKDLLEQQVGSRTAELVLQKDAAEQRKRESESEREAADNARRNITLLSDIGRRVTANLDTEAIMKTLYEHVQVLMEAPVFALAVARPDGVLLDFVHTMVDGQRMASSARALHDPESLAGWCIEHGREVFMNDVALESMHYLPGCDALAVAHAALPCAPGLLAPDALPRALLYVPVALGQRVLGALCVQSFSAGVYQRVHLDMLRTLAAYVGVALDNAAAYRQLTEVQTQLAAQDKLASLGSLVAGVAHELNTPIGNSLLMASTLHAKTQGLQAAFDGVALRRSELLDYLGAAGEASELIMRSLHGAAELVNSFRQVSVDQASAQRRRFDLARSSSEIVATMMNQVRLGGHTLTLDLAEGIVMDSYPGPLGQVLINLVNNALLHAFSGPGGAMRLCARALDTHWVEIVFSDDGQGIAPEHLARVFDPFFTTRMGQGGTGLGLNIAHTIVKSLLGGSIQVDSRPGQGCTLTLLLPVRAVESAAPQADTRARMVGA